MAHIVYVIPGSFEAGEFANELSVDDSPATGVISAVTKSAIIVDTLPKAAGDQISGDLTARTGFSFHYLNVPVLDSAHLRDVLPPNLDEQVKIQLVPSCRVGDTAYEHCSPHRNSSHILHGLNVLEAFDAVRLMDFAKEKLGEETLLQLAQIFARLGHDSVRVAADPDRQKSFNAAFSQAVPQQSGTVLSPTIGPEVIVEGERFRAPVSSLVMLAARDSEPSHGNPQRHTTRQGTEDRSNASAQARPMCPIVDCGKKDCFLAKRGFREHLILKHGVSRPEAEALANDAFQNPVRTVDRLQRSAIPVHRVLSSATSPRLLDRSARERHSIAPSPSVFGAMDADIYTPSQGIASSVVSPSQSRLHPQQLYGPWYHTSTPYSSATPSSTFSSSAPL